MVSNYPLESFDLLENIHPHATGAAAAVVAAHKSPQLLEFYCGYRLQ